jgi:hypothetical protein
MALTNLTKGTVVGSEGGSATTNLAQGLAKAWADYEGSTNTIEDSLNISSVDDDATGVFDYNYTSNMNSNNYAVSCSSTDQTYCGADAKSEVLSSQVEILTHNSTPTAKDRNYNAVTIHGDLA